MLILLWYSGADPGFQVRGAHLKKLHRAEGGAKFVGVKSRFYALAGNGAVL